MLLQQTMPFSTKKSRWGCMVLILGGYVSPIILLVYTIFPYFSSNIEQVIKNKCVTQRPVALQGAHN